MENYRMNYRNNMPRRQMNPVNYGCPQADITIEKKCYFEQMPIAMAYVPYQVCKEMFDTGRALQEGTIFPELCKPFYGKGGGCY